MEELIRLMRASVLLQLHMAQAMSDRGESSGFKSEALLATAGIPTKDIATMTGKSAAAVAKAISRARAARRTDDSSGATDLSTRTGEGNDA